MKKILFTIAFFVCIIVYGQDQTSRNSLYKPIIPIEKQGLLKDIDVIFNNRFALDNKFSESKYMGSNFNGNELRLEIKGKVHERVFFRFRERYTGSTTPESRENVTRSTDMAFIEVDVTSKNKIAFGRMSVDWGGYEFDFSPTEVLEYNDPYGHEESSYSGVGLIHQLTAKHRLTFQVLNSRSRNFGDVYAGLEKPIGVEELKTPLGFVANWRGSFFDGKFETIYSISHFEEAKNKGMNFIALGNKYQNKKFTLMYDFLYSNEGLDRKSIVSNMRIEVGDDDPKRYMAENVAYLSNWIRMEYLITPKINLMLTLMTNNTYWKGNPDSTAPERLYTSYGYVPTVQYMPFKDLNLRFYVAYIGRNYNYTSYTQNNLKPLDQNIGRISIGFIAPLLVL